MAPNQQNQQQQQQQQQVLLPKRDVYRKMMNDAEQECVLCRDSRTRYSFRPRREICCDSLA